LVPDTGWDLPRLEALQRCLFPVEIRASQALTYAALLRLFRAFEGRPGTDLAVVRELRRDWVKRVLARVQIRQWREIWGSGLLPGILRQDPGALGATVPRELYRRVRLRMNRSGRWGRKLGRQAPLRTRFSVPPPDRDDDMVSGGGVRTAPLT
jgi:hypothetical protein